MANKNFKARIGIEAPLIAADNGTTAITLTGADVAVAGDLTVTGNDIKSSGGTTAITLDGTGIIVAGDLRLNGNDIFSSTGVGAISLSGADVGVQGDLFVLGNDIKSSTLATAITLSGADVAVAGDLTITGNDIKSSTLATAITLNDTNVTVAGDLFVVGNEIFSSGGNRNLTFSGTDVIIENDLTVTGNDIKSSTGAIAITLSGANVVLPGTLDVQGGTITDSTGALTISTGASNGNITLDPNGTGDIVLTLANGGNLTNDRNYVFGAIRNATTESNGDIWALNATSNTTPTRGISIDNSADTAKTASYLARTYGAGAGNRSRIILERARGTAASPTAVQAGDLLGEIDATGYSSTGWINDTLTAVPGFFGFTATESWVSNTNLGTSFALNLAPTATTITAGTSLVPTIQSTPQLNYFRSDRFAIAQGKTLGFGATGCSVSGTTLTIGTLTTGTISVGQALTFTTSGANSIYIVANISGSGSGSTWQLSESPGTLTGQGVSGHAGFIGGPTAATTVDALQDLRLIKNTIKGSGGTTQIITSSAGATLELRGDNIQLETAAGTSITGNNITYNRVYGQWQYDATITPAAIDTAYAVPFQGTNAAIDFANIATASNTSQIKPNALGMYKLQFSAQVQNSDNGQDHQITFWWRKNGTDISNSAGYFTVPKAGVANGSLIVGWDNMVEVTTVTDYFELMYAVNSTSVTLPYVAASAPRPGAAAVFLTLVPIGA